MGQVKHGQNAPPAQRNSELGRIHKLKKQLNLSEDAYRCILQQVGGVESSADLDGSGRAKVIAHLQRILRQPTGSLSQAQVDLVQAACTKLGFSPADLEGILASLFKKPLLSFTNRDFDKLVSYFEQLGFTRTNSFVKPTAATVARWYWSLLAEAGKIDNGSEQALSAFLLRQAGSRIRADVEAGRLQVIGADPLAWVPKGLWSDAIEAFKKMLRR